MSLESLDRANEVRVSWSERVLSLHGSTPMDKALRAVLSPAIQWVVIVHSDGLSLYAFEVLEFMGHPAMSAVGTPGLRAKMAVEDAIGLRGDMASTRVYDRPTKPLSPSYASPERTGERYVQVNEVGMPVAVGESRSLTNLSSPLEEALFDARFFMADTHELVGVDLRSLHAFAAPPPDSPVSEDGTDPRRYPWIEVEGEIRPGTSALFRVDLTCHPHSPTIGAPIEIRDLSPDWESLDVTVVLYSADVEFDSGGRGPITIRRNTSSVPLRIRGFVRLGIPIGTEIHVSAQFFHGTRLSGAAIRAFRVGGDTISDETTRTHSDDWTLGGVVVEHQAEQPDLTVHIFTSTRAKARKSKKAKIDEPNESKELIWQCVTNKFDGLPPRLNGAVTLDGDQRTEAIALFAEFAALELGDHIRPLEGLGDRLWSRTPSEFRAVYWALCDHHRRPLTIQFVTDEPYWPWELMRPSRGDDGDGHLHLALMHSVARWIKRWEGYMPNRLPSGKLYTIAPRYEPPYSRLVDAEVECERLKNRYDAVRVEGTRKAVIELLESSPGPPPIAILHFSGHGRFAIDAVGNSSIKLQDGVVTVLDAARRQVRLGVACRTLVIFNACEVGASGTSLGEIGGWADALLSRKFGGFIAPLWSVDDQNAAMVVEELMKGIIEDSKPIGEVMRGIRQRHGTASPTFFSYLFYGDVTARMAPSRTPQLPST